MKNTLTILGFSISSFLNINAQSIVNQISLGGSEFESGVIFYPSGNNIYFLIPSESGISGNKNVENFGLSDAWILKTDDELNILSQKGIGGNSSDFFSSIIESSNKLYLVGSSRSNTNSGNLLVEKYGLEHFVLNISDKNLNTVKQKSYGGNLQDYASDIIEINNNQFWICGLSNSPQSGNKESHNIGDRDFWIVSVDSTGNKNWDKTIGTSAIESLSSIIKINEDEYLIIGSSDGGIDQNKTQSSFGNMDGWIVFVDSDANVLKDLSFGGIGTDVLLGGIRKDNFIYLFGSSSSPISGNKTSSLKGISDGWILKLTLDGEIITEKTFSLGDNSFTQINSIDISENGRILITLSGYAIGSINFISGDFSNDKFKGNNSFVTVELDDNLNIINEIIVGGESFDQSFVSKYFQGKIYIAGSSNSAPSFDKTSPHFGNGDIWVVVLNDLLSLKQPYQQIDVSVFPNPSNGIINLQMNEWTNQQGSISAFVSDMSGRNVAVFQNLDLANTLNLSHLRAGHYLLNLVQNGSKIYTHKLVIGD